MLIRYVVTLLRKWIVWVFFLLDVIGVPLLVVSVLNPSSPIPIWVLWIVFVVAVLCFALASYLVFKDQEGDKRHLQNRIDELEEVEARLKLRELRSGFSPGHGGRSPSFVQIELDQYGYESSGVPGWATVWIDIQVENVGYKIGELIMEFDREKSQLPSIIGLGPPEATFGYGPFPNTFDPQRREEVKVTLDFFVVERDPANFAAALKELDKFTIFLSYFTRRIGGESDESYLVLEGNFDDFRQEIIEHWNGFGFQNLTKLATASG